MTRGKGPTIDELLADSLINAIMRADHVEPDALRSLMNDASARVGARRKEGDAGRRVLFANPAFDGSARLLAPPVAPPEARAPSDRCETVCCW
jgi:hypothetical protein